MLGHADLLHSRNLHARKLQQIHAGPFPSAKLKNRKPEDTSDNGHGEEEKTTLLAALEAEDEEEDESCS